MENHGAPRSVQHHISTQQVGTEILVYDEQRHKAFCLNQLSSVIWILSDGSRTLAEIAAAASLRLQTPISEELASLAIAELRADGLIEPSSTPDPTPAVSRRDLIQRLAVGGAMLLPAVAAIVAPTAAQAYSGCFDCDTSQPSQPANARQLARARTQQSNSLNSPTPAITNAPTFAPYTSPGIGQPIPIDPKLQR